MPSQTTASDFPFYDIFVPQKVPLSKIPDDVIACDLVSPPIKKSWIHLCAEGGGISGRTPPKITACAPEARLNFGTSTREPANFCPKTGHHKRFFSMKQQHRSSKRDQVA